MEIGKESRSELDAILGTDFLPPLVSQAPSARLPPLACPQKKPLGLRPLLPWTRSASEALPPMSDSLNKELLPQADLLLPKGSLPFHSSFIYLFIQITNTSDAYYIHARSCCRGCKHGIEQNNGVSPCSHGNYVLVGKRDNKQINIYDTKKVMQNWPLVGGDV